MSKLKNFWDKLKNIKHLHIILAVIVGLIALVAYFGFFHKPKQDKITENSTEEYSSSQEYVQALENKLINVISKISGVGGTSVILTLESGFSYEYATDIETKTVATGGTETTVKTETVILVSGQPVVTKQIFPVVKGVVIVAKGAENFKVKMDILSAVQAVLDVESEKIEILA